MKQVADKTDNADTPLPVLAAGFIGPALAPNGNALWRETELPRNADGLVQEIMGQPMRRAGRFIKLVCCGALVCLNRVPPELWRNKKTGIFLATGLGNVDEIMPFITQVFKHEGGFPSPNQFANSVSNAAAFFLARICAINGVVLTVSQEELSFESALWLARNSLEEGEIDLALVGGCDVFTPTPDDYRERMNLRPENSRSLPMGEGSSWLLLARNAAVKTAEILSISLDDVNAGFPDASAPGNIPQSRIENIIPSGAVCGKPKILLPGFRIFPHDYSSLKGNEWLVDDYLPYCGMHPTAAAFGIARAVISGERGFYIHYNRHASGRKAFVALNI